MILYITSVISIIILISLIIAKYTYRPILLWLRGKVDHQRYKAIIDRFLNAIDTGDWDKTIDIGNDFIHLMFGNTKYHAVKYRGKNTICPISHEVIKKGDEIIILPCGCFAHKESMRIWISKQAYCPKCAQIC